MASFPRKRRFILALHYSNMDSRFRWNGEKIGLFETRVQCFDFGLRPTLSTNRIF